MLISLRDKKGQNTAEYAIVIALVIGAVIAMQVYVKRSMNSGIKFAVDSLTREGKAGQYEPYYTKSDYTRNVETYTDTEETLEGGEVKREIGVGAGKVTKTSGYQEIQNTEGSDVE